MMYQWHYTLTDQRDLPPLLLLHGWLGSGRDYRPAIELLQDTFHCVTVDLPGHGQTQVLGDDRGYEFAATAGGMMQLLDRLQIDRCWIAGYSLGGRFALYLSLEFPDRFPVAILESASPGLATASARQERRERDRAIIQQLQTLDLSTFLDRWYQQPIFQGIRDTPDFPDLIRSRLANHPELLAKSLQYAGLGEQPYLGDRLSHHRQPVMLIVGEHDRKFVQLNAVMANHYQCSNLQIVPNCSHNIHYQQPSLWVDLVKSTLTSNWWEKSRDRQ
jgi:2-succinyl-6-hydroxy-2,4-cyclohexadiene-1-carboxylate synthase